MSALHELQQAFAASLLLEGDGAVCGHIIEDGFSAAERLRIYRNTFRSTLTEALRLAYPAVDRLVGRDFFDRAAERFIHATPPSSAYLNEYGDGFADFLAGFEPAGALPYLPDVARFEWALSVAANAVDAPVLAAEALAAIDPQHHARLRFEPHPSVSFLALAYGADEIADAVMSGDDAAIAEIDASSRDVRLVVHRGLSGVEAQGLVPDAYVFVSRLCGGEPLGHLLEKAPAGAPVLIAEQLVKGRLKACRIDDEEP
jgi:hypothetical protein